MSRKDFRALAAALRANRVEPIAGWENVHAQWKGDVLTIADVCARYSRFDRDRFLRACGIGGQP